MKMRDILARFTLLLAIVSPALHAHSSSNAFLALKIEGNAATGHLQLRVQDVIWLADLDSNRDAQLTWTELQSRQHAVQQAALRHLHFASAGERCTAQLESLHLEKLNTGLFVSLPLHVSCPQVIRTLDVSYTLLMATDAAHRGIVEIQAGGHGITDVFTPTRQHIAFDAESTHTTFSYWSFIEQGIWHIWTGYDHLLFLLALLLPLFLARKPGLHFALPAGMTVMRAVLVTVTAFTLAHSLTLLLATLLQIELASAAVETVIALSVALSGLNIVYPVFGRSHAVMAFCFGLIHGLGFAGALRDLTLPTQQFVQSLLSFNIGVEAGQLAIVAMVFPLLLYLRGRAFYQRMLQPMLAFGIVSVGVWWALERSAAL